MEDGGCGGGGRAHEGLGVAGCPAGRRAETEVSWMVISGGVIN